MSRARLEEHRRLWAAKPILARVYEPWFAALLAACPQGGRVLEVGAGPGFLEAYARRVRPDLRWISSDLCAAPWLALSADAARLPLAAGSCDAVVGLDVLHHLSRPREFLGECSRVLRGGARLALIEPWITPLAFVVYRFFHHERCVLSVDPWDPFPAAKDAFDGNAALPWRIVRASTSESWRGLGFEQPQVRRVTAFAYLLSLGFRGASLLPEGLSSAVLALDRMLAWVAPLAALRAEIRLRRVFDPGPSSGGEVALTSCEAKR